MEFSKLHWIFKTAQKLHINSIIYVSIKKLNDDPKIRVRKTWNHDLWQQPWKSNSMSKSCKHHFLDPLKYAQALGNWDTMMGWLKPSTMQTFQVQAHVRLQTCRYLQCHLVEVWISPSMILEMKKSKCDVFKLLVQIIIRLRQILPSRNQQCLECQVQENSFCREHVYCMILPKPVSTVSLDMRHLRNHDIESRSQDVSEAHAKHT